MGASGWQFLNWLGRITLGHDTEVTWILRPYTAGCIGGYLFQLVSVIRQCGSDLLYRKLYNCNNPDSKNSPPLSKQAVVHSWCSSDQLPLCFRVNFFCNRLSLSLFPVFSTFCTLICRVTVCVAASHSQMKEEQTHHNGRRHSTPPQTNQAGLWVISYSPIDLLSQYIYLLHLLRPLTVSNLSQCFAVQYRVASVNSLVSK